MERINPAIINRIRAESNVGPDSIEHSHHQPNIPKPREPQTEESVESAQQFTPERTSHLSQMFRSAIRGLRGGGYDPTET